MPTTLTKLDAFKGGAGIVDANLPVGETRDLATTLREVQTIANAAEAGLADVTSPFDYKGNIAAAGDFPLIATVDKGDFYLVTTGCTDNGGATRTNTGQVFLTGDQIVWNSATWTIVERGVSTANPAGLGVAAAGTSPIKSNQDHVHPHGDLAGGTLHADVVAGVSSGFMTAARASAQDAQIDDHVFMSVTGLDMKTDEHEHSGALNGSAAKLFLATHLLFKSTVNVGGLNADGTINVGTSADGAQLVSGQALTGIGAVGTARMVPLAAHGIVVAGNATLYVNVESPETGAGTLEIDVFVVGRQI